ncbi:MAG: hypothetical protein NC395_05830 [Prevotella sp.]|nr:hypothetical protein [Prevotella sp.]
METENKKLKPNDMLTPYFRDGVTKILSEHFDVKCCEKGYCWFTPWEGHQRKAFCLHSGGGIRYTLNWGYNYDFIPERKNSGKFVYHRTEKAVAVNVADNFFNHVDYDPKRMSHNETFKIREKYCLSLYNFEYFNIKDVNSAYEYVQEKTRLNIPFMLDFFGRVRTVDDAVEYLDREIAKFDTLFGTINMRYTKAFLHAYLKQPGKAEEALGKIYENGVPNDIAERIKKVCETE